MKNILYKFIKKNTKLYDFIINKLIEDMEPELVYRIVGNRKIIASQNIENIEGSIQDSILINVNITNSSIGSIFNNKMERTNISNNIFGKQ